MHVTTQIRTITTSFLLLPPLHKLAVVVTHLNSAPLPLLVRVHRRRCDVTTLGRLQDFTENISHPDQYAVGATEALDDFVLATASGSVT